VRGGAACGPFRADTPIGIVIAHSAAATRVFFPPGSRRSSEIWAAPAKFIRTVLEE